MRIIPILVAVMAVPFMAVGQAPDQQPGAAQGQTNQNHETTPAQKQPKRRAHEATKAETDANTRAAAAGESHNTATKKTQTNASGHTQGKTVNKEEFRSTHKEVFTLGRHPKEYFIQRYGATHFRLIGNTYFVFVDGCWVSVDVIGFAFIERVICEGDPDYVVVY